MNDNKNSHSVNSAITYKNHNIHKIRTIPYPESYNLSYGATKFLAPYPSYDSPYYKTIDFFTLSTTPTRIILPHFATYQQTRDYTCGPSVILMLLFYYEGIIKYDELTLAQLLKIEEPLFPLPTYDPTDAPPTQTNTTDVISQIISYGTTPLQIVDFFKQIGYDVTSSISITTHNSPSFSSLEEFKSWVMLNLTRGIPILVEWADLGGHWQIIIGYDTLGTTSLHDDILILADPYDITDHVQDGYYCFPVLRFFLMWTDFNFLPKDQRIQPWIIATPPNNTNVIALDN